ncbi:uncharacterized protein H6S33_010993 [Morchella sextelata]|uniref:uncharacterized protein n=1 Tax=Morchella sextelata TaxID=1174677 RepID=UPI001D04711B|nr:uncharacterized protein H6S33_010993 [Morchella sextelata]KAH0611728.1 hypothetical protein H6S33_010993 [Morchella sextelata]
MATPSPARNPGPSPFVTAVSTHLSHVFIMEVWDVNNVFAADGSVNRRFRDPTRRPPADPTSPEWAPPNYTTSSSGLQRGTRVPEPARTLPTISERSGSSGRSTAGSTLSEAARRSMELAELLQRSSMDPVTNTAPHAAEPAAPIDIEALTGPRPVPQFQPLTLYPSAMESSAAVFQTVGQTIARRGGRNSVQFGNRRAHLSFLRGRRSLPCIPPEWFTRDQNEALRVLLGEEEERGNASGCRFCGGTCNRGRDICVICILLLEGEAA